MGVMACGQFGCPLRVRIQGTDSTEEARLMNLVLDQHKCVEVPPNWPPQVGDVWLLSTVGLVAIRAFDSTVVALVLEREGLGQQLGDELPVEELLAHGPQCVYRRGQEPK